MDANGWVDSRQVHTGACWQIDPSASSHRFVRVDSEHQHVAQKQRDFVEELATSEQVEVIVVGATDQYEALRFLWFRGTMRSWSPVTIRTGQVRCPICPSESNRSRRSRLVGRNG